MSTRSDGRPTLAALAACAALLGCGEQVLDRDLDLAESRQALSSSKLGPHVNGPGNANAATILNACPRLAKWLVVVGNAGTVASDAPRPSSQRSRSSARASPCG